jgi:hypothetical protein
MTPIFINKQVFLESRRSSSRMLGLGSELTAHRDQYHHMAQSRGTAAPPMLPIADTRTPWSASDDNEVPDAIGTELP